MHIEDDLDGGTAARCAHNRHRKPDADARCHQFQDLSSQRSRIARIRPAGALLVVGFILHLLSTNVGFGGQLGPALLCHITEMPRDTSSRAIPGVSLQKRGAAWHSVSAGAPIPTPSHALPRVFYIRPHSRVHGLALRAGVSRHLRM